MTPDPTLEFQSTLSAERLFLNRFPSLRDAFQPIARDLLRTASDFLTVSYLFVHYATCEPIVRLLMERNSVLNLVVNGSEMMTNRSLSEDQKKANLQLVPPILDCIDKFFLDESIVTYFIALLLYLYESDGRSEAWVRHRSEGRFGDHRKGVSLRSLQPDQSVPKPLDPVMRVLYLLFSLPV